MNYHYGSYQPEAHYQASLPPNLPPQLYCGPQDVYTYGEDHNREIYSVPYMNSGLQMVPQPQYSNMQHTVYHPHYPSDPQSVLYSSQSYPQPQSEFRHVDHRPGFDITNQPQRNVYLPPQLCVPNHTGFRPQLQFAQSAPYASTGPYDPVPNFGLGNSDLSDPTGLGLGWNNVAPRLPSNSGQRQVQSPPDTNILDGLPPLKRVQGRYAHMNAIPRWEPKKAQTVKPRLRPQFSLFNQPKGSIKGSNRDWSTLQPGAVHTLIPAISFVSSSPLDEYLQDAATPRDSVMYLPRCADFSGKDKDPRACISFSLDGMPGPYLLDLAEERVIIDGEDDKVFQQFGWRSTKVQIDWPGLSIPPEGLKAFNKDGLPLRRGELATFLATSIAKLIINTQRGYALPMGETQKLSGSAKYWDIMKVDYNHLRLISANHYDKVWVPVLALDIAPDNM